MYLKEIKNGVNIPILAFFAGTVFGVVMMCCFIMAGQEERNLEKLNTDNADNG